MEKRDAPVTRAPWYKSDRFVFIALAVALWGSWSIGLVIKDHYEHEELTRLEVRRMALQNELDQKTKYLQELEKQSAALKAGKL